MTTLYIQDGAGFRQADVHAVIHEAQTILAWRFRVGRRYFRPRSG